MSRREKREQEEKEEKERKKRQKETKKKKTKKNKKEGIVKKIIKTILKIILVILLLAILIIGSFVGWLGFTNNWDWNKMLKKGAKQVALLATGQTEADLANLDPIYCLVLGISTDEGIELTDTIMVCAYYPRTQQASMLSIPRDTFVGKSEATAGGNDKINARYQLGGIKEIQSAVKKITGLEINNYVIIKNGGLVELIDAIGGVEYDIPINMDYDDPDQGLAIHLRAGKQKLNGRQAEGLVRFRHNNDNTSYPMEYGDNDLGRMKTQRLFITETIKQTLKFKNVTKINELIQIAFRNIETNLDMDYVMKYSPAVLEFDVSSLQATALTGTTPQLGPQQLYFFKHNQTETKKIVQELFTFKQEQYDAGAEVSQIQPSNIKIQLLNATGDETILEDTQKRLEEKGYNIEKSGITTLAKTTKVVNRTEKKSEIVDELIDTLGYGDETIGQNSQEYDFTIIIGEDMKQY